MTRSGSRSTRTTPRRTSTTCSRCWSGSRRSGSARRVSARCRAGTTSLDTPTRARSLPAVDDPAAVPERKIRLTLHYDGSGFAGWQAQPGKRTVQGDLEAALSLLTARPASAIAAGRTDSGVHATGQVVVTLVPDKWTAAALRKALNAVMPRDIWVAAASPAPARFHARYDAVARGYTYRVGLADSAASPFLRRWCWPLLLPLRTDLLEQAATKLLGTHSFAAFAKRGQPQRGALCRVH
ncbi:MAG: tRNA pseudouridine synthase A, partial [Gemmatimonadetes bacterium]|nr:tRNA pseudouridine synthase A [Gemmatimonadota bacterium]